MSDKGKITVIFGPNGSGKTRWAEQKRREMASDSVRYLAFSDAYGPATDRAYYLQLRWNQHDIDQETPTVGKLLGIDNETDETRRQWLAQLIALFGMSSLLDKYVILLSSGELRKFQLIKTLLARPKTLILDNPYIGLDAAARDQLNELFPRLAEEEGIDLYLLLSRKGDIPAYAQAISRCEVRGTRCEISRREGTEVRKCEDNMVNVEGILAPRTSYLEPREVPVITLRNVSIRYGERTILRDLDWTVMKGERWALCGPNGCGKSTLLSLVCADNPQSYACDIRLFGHQRGSGESIWEIKRHIGYVSPEMHRSYLRPIPTLQVVASGLKDTVGLYIRPTAAEKDICREWMRRFGIEHLAERSFMTLSSGEQRLALVARAFVKNPDLLILDEPLHGLDDNNRQLVLGLIEDYCQDASKTLIMVTHYEEEIPHCIHKRINLTKQ